MLMKTKIFLCLAAVMSALLLLCATACSDEPGGRGTWNPVDAISRVRVSIIKKTDIADHDIYFTPEDIDFTVQVGNSSYYPIDRMYGILTVYNEAGDLLCTINTSTAGFPEIKNMESKSFTMTAKDVPTAILNELYYTHTEDLRAYFEITSLKFREYDGNGNYKVLEVHEMPPRLTALGAPENGGNLRQDERDFRTAARIFAGGGYEQAKPLFEKIPEGSSWRHKSMEYANRCQGFLSDRATHLVYEEAMTLYFRESYAQAYTTLKTVEAHLDAAEWLPIIRQKCLEAAENLLPSGKYAEALKILDAIEQDKASDLYQSYALAADGNFPAAVDKGLTVAVLPEGMEQIPDGYLAARATLQKVVLPSTVRSIGKDAFKGCVGLTDINLPSYVSTVGDSAFEGCTALKNVTFKDELRVLGDSAFRGCTVLDFISLPASVISVGAHCFEGCSKLSAVSFADRNGWVAGGQSVDLSDAAAVAKLLTSEAGYCDATWTKG